jgi:hypothetical protein
MKQMVLFHTHGLGRFDFSDLKVGDLIQIDKLAEQRNTLLCASVFLTQTKFSSFGNLMGEFGKLKSDGQLRNLLGFAIEGPVLGSKGGVPSGSVWRPTAAHWHELVEWCSLGLKYVVVAPDVLSLDEDVGHGLTFGELLTLIYECGGRVALGHFEGKSAALSATRLEEVLAHIEGEYERSPYLVLTDHLFNDMPRSFRHAFRTPLDWTARESELERHHRDGWSPSSLRALLGPVPAALLTAALDRRLTPSLNFDGGHVDLAICRKVVDYLGADRIIAITDHTEIDRLAGEVLARDERMGLLYRSDGVLAASAVPQEQQRRNMKSIGMSDSAIDLVLNKTPLAALSFVPCKHRPHTV